MGQGGLLLHDTRLPLPPSPSHPPSPLSSLPIPTPKPSSLPSSLCPSLQVGSRSRCVSSWRVEMEVGGGRRRLSTSKEGSSDGHARLSYSQQQYQPRRCLLQEQQQQPTSRVQVVYYLCRNGRLEQPHFIELPSLPNQQHLRLRDVIERLTLLRGRGMPSLFSWSCKRSYKNGYVWNDLTENDIVYPADGVEYVLKGSEIIPGAYERLQHINPASSRDRRLPPVSHKLHFEFEEDEEEEDEAEDLRRGEGGGGRRSRGVSTDEFENRSALRQHHAPTELPLDDSSPPSSTSSDKPPAADEAPGSVMPRNSVLLQLIACGSAALKGRSGSGSGVSKAAGTTTTTAADLGSGRRGSSRRHGVAASRAVTVLDEEEEELRSVVGTPRFCHPLVEDKEYFSGSIVEGSKQSLCLSGPSLKKSSSYNEERSSKTGIEEEGRRLEVEEQEETARGRDVKGKCIPGRRKSSVKQQQ